MTAWGVAAGTVLVALGCGTGSFAIQAARLGAIAHGVDVSSEMLAFARRRAVEAGVELSFHQAGFLTYDHAGPPADIFTTKSALHQLPDFWKQIALTRMRDMLGPGALLYIWDAIFSFEPRDFATRLPAWVEAVAQPEGQGFARSAFETHTREEFSTFAANLEAMVTRTGFEIADSHHPAPWYGELLCRALYRSPVRNRHGTSTSISSIVSCFTPAFRRAGTATLLTNV